jgi:hypothetical protein
VLQSKEGSESDSDTASETSFNSQAPNIPQLPQDVSAFFSTVAATGYPMKKVGEAKIQPWLKVWDGIVEPDSKGELLVACPKKVDFGEHASQ